MALGLFSKEPGYTYAQELKEIRATGADHVSIVLSWYQQDIRSTKIYPRWQAAGDFDTMPDENLKKVIRAAREAGLKIFLFPILRIENRKDREWRGVVAPSNKAAWLKSYADFTLHYARLAQETGVELFSVGSELCSMEAETEHWKDLIQKIRAFYRGKLLYSANWDHYQKINFWDDLDYLGMNGYYELTASSHPTLDELLLKWWGIENEIANWQDRHHKKIIFTEIGYPSVDGGCSKPWDYTRDVEADPAEQALCYEAFFLSWASNKKLAGVYFWNWYGQGGTNDRSYTPRGKPAEQVLSRWYQESTWPSLQSSLPPPAEGFHPQAPATSLSF